MGGPGSASGSGRRVDPVQRLASIQRLASSSLNAMFHQDSGSSNAASSTARSSPRIAAARAARSRPFGSVAMSWPSR